MDKRTVLIIGSGGREHALGWKIKQSPFVRTIYFAPGNAGTKNIGENVDIGVKDVKGLLRFAKEKNIDVTIVGPEAPLVLGIVDRFQKEKMTVIGPSKKASQIEQSKIFSKTIMMKYGIPTANFVVFHEFSKADSYLKKAAYPLVVKADGLCTGKGVAVCNTYNEGKDFLRKLMVEKVFGASGENVIIEECLYGQEISFTVVTDGTHSLSFLPSQDHKQLLDKDRGPNTGGMGAYAPVPFVTKALFGEIEKKIVKPIISAMKKEGCEYHGILYPGLLLTKDGPKVLEFNCRFGDPETQPLMMLLKSDLFPILLSTVTKTVHKQKLIFKSGFSVCVILVSDGYPGPYTKGEKVNGLHTIHNSDIQIFQAGTMVKDGDILTHGGRVLGVTAYGPSIDKAIKKAYSAIGKKGVFFKGMRYRKDIGYQASKK